MSRILTSMIVFIALLLATLVLLAVFSSKKSDTKPPIEASLANGATLSWTSCWFKVPTKRKVRCGWYKPNGKYPAKLNIRIPVVYIHFSHKTQPDPVLYINGGPGFATGLDSKGISRWLNWVDQTGWERDVVFWDHRGTGLATPLPRCKHLNKSSIYSLGKNETSEQEVSEWFDYMQKCHQTISKLKIPLSTFSTKNSVQDSINIMALIGAKRWKIYSASYGTRVALHILRRKPDTIDAVVLDSVYPVQIHDLEITPLYINRAFNNLFKTCSLHYFCYTKFPSLEKSIKKVVADLNANPQIFTIEVPDQARSIKVVLNGNRFLWALHSAMYDWTLIEKLPYFILSAQNKQWEKLEELVKDYTAKTLDSGFSPIAYYSTECRDRNRKLSEQDYKQELDKYPFIRPHVSTLWKYDICKFWTAGRSAKENFVPVKSSIPTLIMNGKLDPATPWQWAAEVHNNFENSFLFVIKGVGHGAVDGDGCASSTAKLFFNKPNQKPILACQKRWRHPHFKHLETKTTKIEK